MSPQYTYDNNGNAVGVFLPINDWNKLKDRYSDLDQHQELPQWQKDIIDHRMMYFEKHPERVTSLDNFLEEMEKEANEEV